MQTEPIEPHSKMPPCLKIDCADLCCKYGVDVLPEEYENLIAHHLAEPAEFTGPEADEEDGVMLYRTAEGTRGCIFLSSSRGCRLHNTQYKPIVCQLFPRDKAEALEAYQDGYLPCINHYMGREVQTERPSPSTDA
jgi:Fe-S-cluster containining protein